MAMNDLLVSILFLVSSQITKSRLLTLEDYTLYFEEYQFEWSNAGDWNVITADNTQKNVKGKEYTKIVACTLNVKGLKKNLCVHTKSEGGFTLKFQDFPQTDSAWNNIETSALSKSAHSEIENSYDEDDIYNLELDFLNDDDWSEINAIWNWNIQQNEQHMKQNKLYHKYYAQYVQHNPNPDTTLQAHRRLMNNEEEEMEFLFGKKNNNNNNNNQFGGNNNRRPGFFSRLFGGRRNDDYYQGGYGGNGGYGMHHMNPMMMGGGYGMNPMMMNGMNPMMMGGGYGMNPMMMNQMGGGMMNQMGGGMMSPMSHMFMQMMQMKLYMQMMKRLMPQRGHNCDPLCDSAETESYGDLLYDDYDDLYDGYYSDLYEYNDKYKRRLTAEEEYDYYPYAGLTDTGTNGGFQTMMNKVPQMMMNLAMMKSMGHMMKHTNPYIAMMMLHQMNPHKHGPHDSAASHCASSCNPMGVCNCHPMGMYGYNHLPMACPSCVMGARYMMNPMQLGMPGMMQMNPMMLAMMSGAMHSGMQSMNGMNPMMLGLMAGMMAKHPNHEEGDDDHLPHVLRGWFKMMKHGAHGPHSHNINVLGSMANMIHHASHMNPMVNANLGYMMGRAVKKCQPLKNGLEICAMYNPMTNQLNVDIKSAHGKKLKRGKPKRLFPKKLGRMIKMLVKQRVFGHTGDELLGGELQRRFKHHVGMEQKEEDENKKGAKGTKDAKDASGGEGQAAPAGGGGGEGGASFGAERAGSNDMGDSGVNMEGMDQMEHSQRRMLMEEGQDFVQFDTMEGNIGYEMWRAELMDWHNFDDFDENEMNDFMDYGEYKNFGNFVHYFDTLEFNWNDENNWSDFDDVHSKSFIQFDDDKIAIDLGQKCGHKLPFLNFKLCSKVTDDDIRVFFKRTAPETFGARVEDDDNHYYNQYLDAPEYEWNDVQTLRDIIDYEFEHSLFRFKNDEDWHEIITSQRHNNKNKRHLQEEGGIISSGSRLGEHDHRQTEITLFGHLYRLKGISQCGGGSDSPMFCVGIHLGQAIKLPKALELPLTKMCNFMYIAKVCLGFDPNRMELKLSIQFQSIHKWKDIARRILDVIKHLPHKTKRYMRWASRASMDVAAKVTDDDILGKWHEDDGSSWIISSAAKVSAEDVYWEDNDIWDDIKTITTDNGHDVQRKCMQRMVGRRLCFCQFVSWIDAKRYHCHQMKAMMNEEEVVSDARGLDLNMDNYINLYLDYDGHAMNDMDSAPSYGLSTQVNGDMSDYYDVIGPQIKLDGDGFFKANFVNKDDNYILYDYAYEDDENGDEEIELHDDIDSNFDDVYEELKDELNAMDTKFSAADFFDSNYDSLNKQYAYNYDDYFGDETLVEHTDDAKELNDDNNEESDELNQSILFDVNSFIQINSNLFWPLSLLAVLFGAFLCSVFYYYLKRRQKFVKEFRNHFNSFIVTSQYCSKPPRKYGFNPVSVAISNWDSNDSEDDQNKNNNDNVADECV